jgi:rare lipoprotein A
MLLLPVTLLFTGCGTLPDHNGFSHWGDGAPSRPVDLSKIANAEPRIVPYSRSGNPDSYIVNGRRYHVLSNSAHFRQSGIASWYGTKFHGHKTSSGEPYDMYAMTAAHKTLPLPTWVEVTNRSNGKRVIVKVNDRGPFIANRILDLSYAAAAKLGVTKTGTAPVTVRAIDPAVYLARKKQQADEDRRRTASTRTPAPAQAVVTTAAPLPPPATIPATAHVVAAQMPPRAADSTAAVDPHPVTSADTAGFYLQVAAFSDRHNAERLRRKLMALEPASVRIDSTSRSGNPFYRVRIGPISSLTEAGKLAARVSSLGLGEPKLLLD